MITYSDIGTIGERKKKTRISDGKPLTDHTDKCCVWEETRTAVYHFPTTNPLKIQQRKINSFVVAVLRDF